MPEPIPTDVAYGVTTRGFHQKNIFADMRSLLGPEVSTVFDVGAHRGEEAATFRRLFPSAVVHCFEPTPERAAQLRQAFAEDIHVRVHEVALSNRDGEAAFYSYPSDATNSLLPFEQGAASIIAAEYLAPEQRLQVRSERIETFCRRLQLDVIDLLKLDVQGAEKLVLEGGGTLLRDHRIRLLSAEVTFVPVYERQVGAAELIGWLAGCGYELYDLYNFAYADSGQLLWGDALFRPADERSRRRNDA